MSSSHTVRQSAPRNVSVARISPSTITATWLPPLAGPPTSHYLVDYIFLAKGSNAATKEKKTVTVEATDTSLVLKNAEFPEGALLMFVVTSVNDDVSESSEMEYLIYCTK